MMHTNNVFELVSVDPVRRTSTMDSDSSDLLGITHISRDMPTLETNIPLRCIF